MIFIPSLDFATWTFVAGAAMAALGLLFTIAICIADDTINPPPGPGRAGRGGQHRRKRTVPNTTAVAQPIADDTIDLGLVTG